MYRIRSASGTEAVYHSLEEFSVAVHRGDVHPEDEIFHTRANRWLDVKSHPHYRSALDWSGPSITPASPASVPTQAVARPVPSPALAAPAPARAQVFERPQVKPAPQTTLRPQLQASPAPKAPAAAAPAPTPAPVQATGPAPKSRELNFVDLGDAGAKRSTAAVAEAPKKVAPPVPSAEAGPTELEFLVMDGGIESPVRSSTGHRTIPEDLDLLFDTPLEETEKPVSGRVSTGKVPKVVAAPIRPAPKSEPVAPKPVVTVAAPVAPAPAPKPPVQAVPKVEVRAEHAIAAAPAPAPVAAPVQAEVATPAHAPAPTPRVTTAENLAIPGGPLAAKVEDFPAELALPRTPGTPRSHTLMIAGIVVSLVASGGLLAWHPWSGAGTPTTADAEQSPTPPGDAPATRAPDANKTVALNPPAAPAASTPTKPVAPLITPAVVKVDSSLIKPAEETVIAAVRPNFSGAVDVRATDLQLGNDVRTASTTVAVSPAELTRRLESSERQAEQELQSRLAAAGFRAVFAGDRLATPDGVTGARSAWSAGGEAIRQFRARVTRLEQAYEDSVLSSQRTQRWSGEEMRIFAAHQSPAEPAEVSQLSDLMMNQVSEALEILAALDGQYDMKGGVIAFRTPASATRYTGIHGWVEQRMQTWQAIPEGARPRSISALLRALGDGLPGVR